jgi:hypothetical protein
MRLFKREVVLTIFQGVFIGTVVYILMALLDSCCAPKFGETEAKGGPLKTYNVLRSKGSWSPDSGKVSGNERGVFNIKPAEGSTRGRYAVAIISSILPALVTAQGALIVRFNLQFLRRLGSAPFHSKDCIAVASIC